MNIYEPSLTFINTIHSMNVHECLRMFMKVHKLEFFVKIFITVYKGS